MEDFYPFTSENIPELRLLVRESLTSKENWARNRERSTTSYLLPLAINLLDSVKRIHSLKNAFEEEYGGNEVKISDGFWKIVEAYLEENNGTGNLLRLKETMSLYDFWLPWDWEEVFLRYSLPASEGNENANVYSLSRDFLQAGKTDIAGSSVSIWNANSVEQALENSVILEEIFKKLRFVDQKSFRLVSPTWMEETVAFWRRNAKILIHVSRENVKGNGIFLPVYMDLWEKNKKMGDENSSEKKMQRLQDLPFHSYRLCYGELFPFSCGRMENDFWKSCGQFIKDLEIVHHSPKFKANICKRLLQDCQNLRRLKIECFGWEKEDSLRSEKEKTKTDDDNESNNMKIAKHLNTLSLGSIKEEGLKSILLICPNLKTLDLFTEDEAVGALLSPTLSGEFIKLKKLVLWSFPFDDSLSLRQYTEMLARNELDSLEHLKLTTYLSNARSSPFNLYAALAHASKNLKTLELKLCLLEHEDEVDNLEFMDLSPFAFRRWLRKRGQLKFQKSGIGDNSLWKSQEKGTSHSRSLTRKRDNSGDLSPFPDCSK